MAREAAVISLICERVAVVALPDESGFFATKEEPKSVACRTYMIGDSVTAVDRKRQLDHLLEDSEEDDENEPLPKNQSCHRCCELTHTVKSVLVSERERKVVPHS